VWRSTPHKCPHARVLTRDLILHVQDRYWVTVVELSELMASFGGIWVLWEHRGRTRRVHKIASSQQYWDCPAYQTPQVT
jgi:hypothetical protein